MAKNAWVNLNDSYGYVPLKGTAFNVKRVYNEVTVEENEGETTYQNTYFNINIDHGSNPENKSYAYVLLPDADVEETANYSENPDINILSMTNNIHAVEDKTSGEIFINVFKAGVKFGGLTFYTPCAIIIDGSKFFVSDPSWTAESVRIGFDKSISVTSDDEVSVNVNNIVTVNMPISGKTYSFDISEY